MRTAAVLEINGQRHNVTGAQAFMMLADYLRYERGSCGTKIVCAEGDCGACTVLCYRPGAHGEVRFEPINSCIGLVAQFDGCHLVTVEGLKEGARLSPVQEAIVHHHGSQCGFCTPGFVMAMTAMAEKNAFPCSMQKAKNCLTGNLCRCTGYQPLLDAACSIDSPIAPLRARYASPHEQSALKKLTTNALVLTDGDKEFYAPTTIRDACSWRRQNPDGTLILGATDLGVMWNKKRKSMQRLMSFQAIEELRTISIEQDRVVVGARATLSEVRAFLKSIIPTFARFLNIFASWQIKNMGTLVGNLMNGSPIGDTLPFLLVSDACVHLQSTEQQRTVPCTELFTDYKTFALLKEELVTHVSFSVPKPHAVLKLEKVSQRKDLDISTVNAAFLCSLDKNTQTVESARIALGGVDKTVVRMTQAELFLQGKRIDESTIDALCDHIQKSLTPLDDVRGTMAYRRVIVDGLVRRYCLELKGALNEAH